MKDGRTNDPRLDLSIWIRLELPGPLGDLAVRVECKCFVSSRFRSFSAPFAIVSVSFSIVFGGVFDRFRRSFRSFSAKFSIVLAPFSIVFGTVFDRFQPSFQSFRRRFQSFSATFSIVFNCFRWNFWWFSGPFSIVFGVTFAFHFRAPSGCRKGFATS